MGVGDHRPDILLRRGQRAAHLGRGHLLRNSWHHWTPWFQKAGLALNEPTDSTPYDDAGLMMDAVLAGHGIGLVRRVIAHDVLAQGRLVRLSDIEVPFDGAYHFVTSQHPPRKTHAIKAFGEWLRNRLRDDFASAD